MITWIQEKTSTVKPGTKKISPAVLTQALELFPRGVQLNTVGTHCYPGTFVEAVAATNQRERYIVASCGPGERHYTASRSVSNRIRNSHFSQPFIQSLAKIKLPGVDQVPPSPLIVETHDSFMEDALRKVTPGSGAKPTTYTTYLSSKTDTALALVEELILRDNVDVLYNCEAAHRRRRSEWPSLDLTLLNQIRGRFTAPSSALIQKAKQAVNSAAAAGRLQSAVFDLFLILCEREFLDMEIGLADPIDMGYGPPSMETIMEILECFEGPATIDEKELSQEYADLFMAPVRWLAIMIVRSVVDVERLFETIAFTRIIGELIETKFAALRKERGVISFDRDPSVCAGESPPYFGFWLPTNGIRPTDEPASVLWKALNVFNESEKVFKEDFGLSNDQLLTEEQQDEYLLRHPTLEPGLHYSGNWSGGVLNMS
ncbi:hypothetical protein AJ79_06155 [Helicocarpus griseus UAMH5409]|uniref:Uncharacterized protein n=1 Tax=Helicocarpus griseus UAMH5409 TaxID=1447875 RepID=A0A2B7XGI3_9EURO|nr:hypothetical protein AJ79_06155 [Helicocarpus griseus UAMH5409]